MLKHPMAVEGYTTYPLIYPENDPPAGLAGRLRARSFVLLRTDEAIYFGAALFLHGLAQAHEERLSGRKAGGMGKRIRIAASTPEAAFLQLVDAFERDDIEKANEVDSHCPCERSRYVLTQVSSLLTMLDAACIDALALTGCGKTSEFDARNSSLLGNALDGIGTLVDLANFLLED